MLHEASYTGHDLMGAKVQFDTLPKNLVSIRIWGNQPDDGAGTTDQASEKKTADQGRDDGSKTSGGKDGGGSDSGDADVDDHQAALDAANEARREAERKLQERETKDAEAERAKLNADERARQDAETLRQLQEQFDSFKKTTFLELAIYREGKYNWEDGAISDVVSNVDLKKVSFSELKDGTLKADGIDLELKRIAKEKPYLLKKVSDGGDGKPEGPAGQQVSGAHPYGGSDGKKSTDAEIMKKYKIA